MSESSRQPKLLVLRPDNIGDVLLFGGALPWIRRRWADCEITLCVRPHVVNLVEHCPHVDCVVAHDTLFGDGNANALERWRGAAVLLPVRSPSAAMHADVSRVPAAEKLGIAGDLNNIALQDARRADDGYTQRFQVPADDRWRHELEVAADALRFFGCELPAWERLQPAIWMTDDDRAIAMSAWPADDTLTIGLMPEASDACRVWPVERYAAVAEAIPKLGRVVVFGGGERRRDLAMLAGALEQAVPQVDVVPLAGRLSLRETAACVQRCDLLISTETWLLHAAVALGVPTVGIVGGGHYGRFYPWGDSTIHRTAHRALDCYHCNWKCPYSEIHCIDEISVQLVIDEALKALSAACGVRNAVADAEVNSIPSFSRDPQGSGRNAAVDFGGVATLADRRTQKQATPLPTKTGSLAGAFRLKYVRAIWQQLAADKTPIAIFGGGRHTQWLLQQVWDLPSPEVVCILDDAAVEGRHLDGVRMERPAAGAPPAERILLSSDRNEALLEDRCRALFCDSVDVIRLYDGLSPGPYPSR